MPSNPIDVNAKDIERFLPIYRGNKEGIPSVSDSGYLLNEMFDIVKQMFNTKIAVSDGVVQLRNADDEYWFKQGEFVPHKTINFPLKEFNTDELSQTRMLSFSTDVNDAWTTSNYKGTSYEIKTKSTVSGLSGRLIKGLDSTNIPLCLGSTKDNPTVIDKIIHALATAVDTVSKVVGGKGTLTARAERNQINILKVSGNNTSQPKVVVMDGSNIYPNHRDKLSAKYLMENFHYGKSFVQREGIAQKAIYRDIEIPFTLADLKQVLRNGKFTLLDGRNAEFISLSYMFAKDVATATIAVRERYTEKLVEEEFEPEPEK